MSEAGCLNDGNFQNLDSVHVKIDQDLNVGRNVVITGNLDVNGDMTTLSTTNTVVEDVLIKLGQGSITDPKKPPIDVGLIFTRGDGTVTNKANRGLLWNELEDEFAFVECDTEDGTTSGSIPFSGYSDLQCGPKLTVGNNLPATIGHTADGADDDLTIEVTGDVDSSLILKSAGTGADAVKVNATAGGVDIDASGAITIDATGANAISIGSEANTGAINIGNGASARAIQVGNAASTSVSLDALAVTLTSVNALSVTDGAANLAYDGSGAVTLTSVAYDHNATGAITIDATGANAISIGSEANTGAINIGNGASARAITVGNSTGTTSVNITSGTSGVTIGGDASTTRLYPAGVLTVSNHGTGTGITDTLSDQDKFDINTIRVGGMWCTTIHIDLTGLDHSATGIGKVIGDGTDTNCQLLTLTDTTHGQLVRVEMYCNETPATDDADGGNADIDLCLGTDSTSGSVIAATTQLLTAGGNWAAPSAGALATGVTSGYAQSIVPIGTETNGSLLSLAGGAAGSASEYTGGKFIIRLWGAPVGYIG